MHRLAPGSKVLRLQSSCKLQAACADCFALSLFPFLFFLFSFYCFRLINFPKMFRRQIYAPCNLLPNFLGEASQQPINAPYHSVFLVVYDVGRAHLRAVYLIRVY
ncbi:hypothetical protein BDQ94DRAFT_616 [Aspergillus welwitschiae]|uniref:Uncharacterized protein n=1 Tax=Aspergillus welwitschiae TaxID=1341132 RepID=A0A3F3QJ69_9EURO|nr:hypothetical protein BDQ94DRAFT_616 [Aspergillus welwitschiae]RDH38989.1 hypothetical protein BDQ94DRAFT_616 [Aspergillus welwitschiae]